MLDVARRTELDAALDDLGVPRRLPPTRARATALDPLAAARRLRGLPRPALLEASLAEGPGGRYSYFAADPFLTLRSHARRVELAADGRRRLLEADPLATLQALLRRFRSAPDRRLPPFAGGAIGYLAYDLGRQLERLPTLARADPPLPELEIGLYDWVLAADAATGERWLVSRDPARAARVERLLERPGPPPEPPDEATPAPPRMRANFGRHEYLAAVRRVRREIRAGEIFQACISQRLEGAWRGDPWPLYERLRRASPVGFGAYLAADGVTVLSASPERFLRLDGDLVETRPIKGTRPRGATPEADRRLAAELAESEKERAENMMIVDLLRNDLGRVCATGSVHAPELLAVEAYSTVWQLVSTVRGRLRPGLDAVDLLRACFPGGSVTGCPKVRAMALIEEIEPVRRGVYCGAIGYLGFDGAMETSIAIRTLVVADGRLFLQVGGAVTADSDPAAEYAETLDKARAGLTAIGAS